MKKLSSLLSGILFAASLFAQHGSGTPIIQVKPAGGDLWGYANIKGEMVIPAQYSKCAEFSSDGLAPVFDAVSKQYFFINSKGERQTAEISNFRLIGALGMAMQGYTDGMVPVCQGKLWGFLNTKGQLAIPVQYDEVTEFHEGWATVRSGSSFSFINTKGETVAIAGDAADVRSIREGFAPYKNAQKLMGFIGKDGKVAIPAQFESVGYFSNGLAWAKVGVGKLAQVGFINTKGEWVIQPKYSAAKEFDKSTGLARAKNGEQWGYVNASGEYFYFAISESCNDFNEGLAAGKTGKLQGFYNAKGAWAIPPKYDDVRDFKNGYAAVKLGEKWGLIDKSGNVVIQPTFDGIKDVEIIK